MQSPSRSQWQTIYVCRTHKITKIAIGIWSVILRKRSLGSETVRGLGVQTVRCKTPPVDVSQAEYDLPTPRARAPAAVTPHLELVPRNTRQ
ncbi:hypothetical protein EVAR_10777_1 [Eumeta japonica]|uniref:Uncharacterized protein n=1 Tax=Eumeta variegata TaxID=151549 RepID=A0A4C1W8H3_EUMVA|nr:hypothetical protein EVAR_10777_1 [Eumeta japonica]